MAETTGYFPTGFWADGYWPEGYWPLGDDTVADWTGIINSGDVVNCMVLNATTGVERTAGVLANCIIDDCTAATSGSGGSESNNITDGSQELSTFGVPVKHGNCDAGEGDASVGGLGDLDLYGRPRLRADAAAIGPVYPQRDDKRNIMIPIWRFAHETD